MRSVGCTIARATTTTPAESRANERDHARVDCETTFLAPQCILIKMMPAWFSELTESVRVAYVSYRIRGMTLAAARIC